MSKDIQKWVDASIKATELKFALEQVLTKNFSHEEMESLKYRQLLDTVDQYLEHVMGAYRKEKEEKIREACAERIKKLEEEVEALRKEKDRLTAKRSSWWNIRSASIAAVGAVLIELVRLILSFRGG